MKRLLLTPMILAAVGCASIEDLTTFTSLPAPPVASAPIVPAAPVAPESEQRELVPAKPVKQVQRRTVKPKTVDAVTLFPFEENRIYPIATSPGFFTSIHLQAGEKMPGKAALGDPDPSNWIVEKTIGAGPDGPEVILLIKPGRAGLKTNMIIPASGHTYQLDVTSYEKRAMDIVRWKISTPVISQPIAQVNQCFANSETLSFDPTTFNRNYVISVTQGDPPKWIPVSAFDIGSKAFIEFPGTLGQISAPALFVVDNSGILIPASFRVRGRFYEIDRTFDSAELRQGNSTVSVKRSG